MSLYISLLKILGFEPCDCCRFDPEGENDGAGGDCANCRDYSEFRELKRIDEEKCATCKYEEDPCHCDCVECQDGANWTPRPTLKQELEAEIAQHKQAIEKLQHQIKRLEAYL